MVLDGHEASVTSVVASPDENYILSGSMDKTIRIWDANTGQETSVHHTENKVDPIIIVIPDNIHTISRLRRLWCRQEETAFVFS